MATNSINDQKTDLAAFKITVDGSPLNDKVGLAGISIYKSINKISTAKIEIYDGNISDAEFTTIEEESYEPGAKVEIQLGYHSDTKPVFKGIIVKHNVKISSSKGSKIIIECADECIQLTGQRRFKYHKNIKDSALMQRLASSFSGTIDATTKEHEIIIQHNTTDWDMIIARAQANEMLVSVDDGKINAKKPSASSPDIELEYGSNVIDIDLSVDARSQYKKVTAYGWDPKKQEEVSGDSSENDDIEKFGTNLKGKKISGKLGYEDNKIRSTGNLTTDELKSWASATLLNSRMSRIRGTILTQGVVINPTQVVDIKSLGKYYDGLAYVTGVYHDSREGNWTTEIEVGLSPDLFITQKDDVTLPVADGLFPGIHGLFIGIVKEIERDPENEYRVKVLLPMVDGDKGDGVWARVSNIMASNKKGQHGSWFYPEVDDEVVLGALGGDMRFPVILGHLYSSKNQKPGEFDHDKDNNDKGWITREKLLFHFNDKDKIIRLETPAGNILNLDDKDKSILIQDEHGNEIKMDRNGISIKSIKNFEVNANSEIEQKSGSKSVYKAGSTIEASSSATATLKTSSGKVVVQGPIVKLN